MSFRNLPLPAGVNGKLYLHSMLGRATHYVDDVQEIASKNISTVIRLTSDEETEAKSPDYWNAIKKKNVKWKELTFPITDYGIPDDLDAFKSFIELIVSKLSEGQTMLLHCAAGIGRTGTVASAILLQLGVNLEDAVRIVGGAGSFAEDASQVNFLKAFAKGQGSKYK